MNLTRFEWNQMRLAADVMIAKVAGMYRSRAGLGMTDAQGALPHVLSGMGGCVSSQRHVADRQ